MEPLVSILIPAFNVEAFVADAIKSALAQKWRRTEIIVVDDGSTDRTADVCRQYASRAVTVVSQRHQGASATRNTAFSLSHGDYIQWLDADDLLAPDKLAAQLATVADDRNRRVLLSGPWAHFRYRPHRAAFRPTALWADLSPAEWLLRKLEHDVYMSNATWLVGRDLTAAAGPWDTHLLADNDGEYFCRVLLASDGVRFVPDAKVFYRRRIGSLSEIGLSKPKMEAKVLSLEKQIGYLRAVDDSERSRVACLKALQSRLVRIDPQHAEIIARAQRLAAALGGRLTAPRLSWKYAWIEKLFGWTPARRAEIVYNRCKTRLLLLWDRSLARLETLV